MNKKELIEKTAQKAGKSQKEVKETIDALLSRATSKTFLEKRFEFS